MNRFSITSAAFFFLFAFSVWATETPAPTPSHVSPPAPSARAGATSDLVPEKLQKGAYYLREAERTATPYWPYDAFFKLPAIWGKPELAVGSKAFQDEIFKRYGLFFPQPIFARNANDNDGLPMGLLQSRDLFTVPRDWVGRDGKIIRAGTKIPGMNISCEGCHSSAIQGKLQVGVPNPFFNMQRLYEDLNKAANLPTSLADTLFHHNAERHNSIANAADQLGRVSTLLRDPGTLAPNPQKAQALATALATLRTLQSDPNGQAKIAADPNLRHAAEIVRELREQDSYLKTPAWTNYETKIHAIEENAAHPDGMRHGKFYADGGFSDDGSLPPFFTDGLTRRSTKDGHDLREALASWKEYAPLYLRSLKPPRFPFPIDESKAGHGERVFSQTCSRCHGHYEREPGGQTRAASYPARIIPLSQIGTDPDRANFPDVFIRDANAVLGQGAFVRTGGYQPPPLLGIWSRSPYLHNGSVPSIRQLLTPPEERIGAYELQGDPRDLGTYDAANLGWKFRAPVAPISDDARVYDPSKMHGLGNQGHEFGTDLSDADKGDLIEYLKTL